MASPDPNKKQPGQRSLDLPNFLTRVLPVWNNPDWLLGNRWRRVVLAQPIASICRDTLIQNYLSLDFAIEARDSDQKDELKDQIDYYTKGIEYAFGVDYADHVEWIGTDMLDLPFGAAAEVGRENDDPLGDVVWVEPLDGATLFPTLDPDIPVGQRVPEAKFEAVFFPEHAINRVFISPRTEIVRKGWGMAPPEKIYLAMQMLYRGDSYYANLLIDTPEAGLLSLGNMSKSSALEWAESYRTLMTGIDPLKIPILYELEQDPKWIPFGRPPTEMSYDRVTLRYAAIVAAGYGLTLSDIGIQTTSAGGETLAGSIRSERKTRRTGFSLMKRKMTAYWNRLLPPELKFHLIDYDDELNVAKGRARLASATAYGAMIQNRIITPSEARRQSIADGLFTISMPEEADESEFEDLEAAKQAERPNMMGRPVAVSEGGQGEVRD